VVEDVRAGGATSLRMMATEMNGRGILTRRGGRLHVSTVMNLLLAEKQSVGYVYVHPRGKKNSSPE
jgi:hypothetical protein